MRFANAGHPKPLLVRRSTGGVEPLVNVAGQSQPALGLFDDPAYQTTEITLTPGDFVMLFTDGLYEVQGLNEELYSQERMMMDVQSLLSKSNQELFDELLEAIRAFSVSHEFDDDVCIVGMEFTRQAGGEILNKIVRQLPPGGADDAQFLHPPRKIPRGKICIAR